MQTKIVNLIRPSEPDEAVALAKRGYELGANAVIADLVGFPESFRTVATFRRMIAETPGEWLFCLYRDDTVYGDDDAKRMETLLRCAEAGAAYIDVMGDLHDPRPDGLSDDPRAVALQRETVAAIHRFGAKAIVSSHDWNVFYDEARVLEVFRRQRERGADVVKLVCRCDTPAELKSSESVMKRLSAECPVPWVYLGSGRCGHAQRFLGVRYGCHLEFATINPSADGIQPQIAEFVGPAPGPVI